MSTLSNVETQGRWNKLKNRVANEGAASLAKWAAQWIYWNGRLYYLAHPPNREHLRLAYKYRRRNKKYGIHEPILVYQMGKVGSTSVYKSLVALDLDVPVDQTVSLNRLDIREQWLLQANPIDTVALETLARDRRIRRHIEERPNQKWNIICLVRAPLPRGISAFFHNMGATFPGYHERRAQNDLTARELVEYFVNHYFDNIPNEWFDRELRALFGIDVFATEFPKSRGYSFYENERCRVLLMRLEDLERCAAPALYEFLKIPNFELLKANTGEQKEYGELYREFLAILRVTPEWLTPWHESRYAKHFYTPEELEKSAQRWTSFSLAPNQPARV